MIQVVAAIIERNGRILICQRKPSGPHPLKWEFPGGKVEPGETPTEALRRELREELNIEATIGEELERYEYAYPSQSPIELMFYRVTAFVGEPVNLVFEQIDWEVPKRMQDYDFLDADIQFIVGQPTLAAAGNPAAPNSI